MDGLLFACVCQVEMFTMIGVTVCAGMYVEMESLGDPEDYLPNLPRSFSDVDSAAPTGAKLTRLMETVSNDSTSSQSWSDSPNPFARQPSWSVPPLPSRGIPPGSFVLQPVFPSSPSSWSSSALPVATAPPNRAGGNIHYRYCPSVLKGIFMYVRQSVTGWR